MNIGTSIMKIRKQKGLNRTSLAEAIGLSSNSLMLIEQNITVPKKKTFEKITAALGVPGSYIYFMAIDENDIPEEQRTEFNILYHFLSEGVEKKFNGIK